MKRYILIAGVNGAGKSTLYYTMDSLKNMPRVNTDEIVRTFGVGKNPSDVIKAGKNSGSQGGRVFCKGRVIQSGNNPVREQYIAKY